MYLGYKKANGIFEERSNLCLIVLLISFFPLLLWITTENIKNFKKKKAKNFFNTANTQSSPEVSPKEKCKTFIGMCSLFTWLNMQILSLCYRRDRHIQNHLSNI